MYSNRVRVIASTTVYLTDSGISIGAHLGENDLVHLALTETIGADQRVHRDAVLGEPARILQGRGGRFHPLHGDVVAQGVQKGVDVSLDAGSRAAP